jgi:hypothetical protein
MHVYYFLRSVTAALTHTAQQDATNSTDVSAAAATQAPTSSASETNGALGPAAFVFALVGATVFAI